MHTSFWVKDLFFHFLTNSIFSFLMLIKVFEEDIEADWTKNVFLSLSSTKIINKQTYSLMLPLRDQTLRIRIFYNKKWD